MAVLFFTEDVKEVRIPKRKVKTWVNQCITAQHKITGEINYIFCSDEYLRGINMQYLNHDYYTDIITFNYNENKTIKGDIYISLDRVRDNAVSYKVNFHTELQRVVIHGILHLLGLKDSTPKQKEIMRKAEDECIEKYNKIWKEF
ncbi:MAG: rRNA maturation RNase YbeY [Bacteroidales bacterium]|nr:rRNA maturation RNase YbeY [Bacteroidales bacterium]